MVRPETFGPYYVHLPLRKSSLVKYFLLTSKKDEVTCLHDDQLRTCHVESPTPFVVVAQKQYMDSDDIDAEIFDSATGGIVC